MPVLLRPLILSTALFCLPAVAAQAEDWRVQRTTREVQYTVDKQSWHPVEQGMAIPNKAWLSTGPRGRAVLTRGTERIDIQPETLASIITSGVISRKTEVVQQTGSLTLEIEKRSRPHTYVHTPYLAAVVKGTTFEVTVTAKDASVTVDEGLVQVNSFTSGRQANVGPGQRATVDETQRMSVAGVAGVASAPSVTSVAPTAASVPAVGKPSAIGAPNANASAASAAAGPAGPSTRAGGSGTSGSKESESAGPGKGGVGASGASGGPGRGGHGAGGDRSDDDNGPGPGKGGPGKGGPGKGGLGGKGDGPAGPGKGGPGKGGPGTDGPGKGGGPVKGGPGEGGPGKEGPVKGGSGKNGPGGKDGGRAGSGKGGLGIGNRKP